MSWIDGFAYPAINWRISLQPQQDGSIIAVQPNGVPLTEEEIKAYGLEEALKEAVAKRKKEEEEAIEQNERYLRERKE